ncbi:FecR domain-containing protein [Chitinophaga pendula]|uniref:FecR family protein n=1 Tax=Chitinophaga TaxID=79328 RepID=UPI000BAF57D9|nr:MULTISPECIES: FecR domain-containing protein [Chitinophaga]ASZ09516.1 hypothetical protein CK934_00250 [Chitinophaga sp. MD30]UCJ07551.1 FecR domain-containing protein [Chitinophaga pendula]
MEDSHQGLSYIRQLFVKHAEGRTSPAEEAQLIAYLSEGDASALPDIDAMMHTAAPASLEAAASERILGHILSTATTAPRSRTLPLLRWMAAAVTIGIIICIAWFWRQPATQPVWTKISTDYGQLRKLTLADGSVITLNARSELRYDSVAIYGNKREVWLNGEAFFEIAPATKNAGTFVVHAGDSLQVSVLGTQFNVRYTNNKAAVTLNSGKVKVAAITRDNNAEIILTPGQMVLYDPQTMQLQQQTADTTLTSSWKVGQQTFQQASLSEVTGWITTQFGIEFRFSNPALKQLPFSGTIPSDKLESILPILEQSLDIRIDKSGRQMMIRPAH